MFSFNVSFKISKTFKCIGHDTVDMMTKLRSGAISIPRYQVLSIESGTWPYNEYPLLKGHLDPVRSRTRHVGLDSISDTHFHSWSKSRSF